MPGSSTATSPRSYSATGRPSPLPPSWPAMTGTAASSGASDYPLPGVMPLINVHGIADRGLLDPREVPVIIEIRRHNPIPSTSC